jgi:superoxide dismutase, Fe-Mn family
MLPYPSHPMTRRRLMRIALGAGSVAFAPGIRITSAQARAPFALPQLPYPEDGLAPVISSTTIGFHYGKHHKAYIDNLNKAIEDTDWEDKSLEDIVKAAFADRRRTTLFNNAAQAWNHTFYWNSMRPNGGGAPTGVIAEHIKDSFGDFAKFREEFTTAAAAQFGNGWVWLVQGRGSKLIVLRTANADTPMVRGTTCC